MQNINGKNEVHVNHGIMALFNMGITGITVHIIGSLQAESWSQHHLERGKEVKNVQIGECEFQFM